MATTTYVPIQSQTLTSNQAYIDFTSIPATYTDLKIVFNGALATGDTLSLQFNSDTGSNYSYTRIIANGSAYSSYRESSITIGKTGPIVSTSITTPSTVIMDVMNYSNSNTYKTVLSRTADQTYVASYVTLWRNTNSINTIRVRVDSGVNILSGSTATLYGIANADSSNTTPKAFGGTITSDSTYYYHTFTGSNTFTPLQSLTADILVVAGGGGNSNLLSGGGGAGGLLTFTSQALTAQAYPVLVGAGGTGGATVTNGTNGGDSKFGSLTTCLGGGFAGHYNTTTGSNGNSGGSGGGGGTGDQGAGGGSGGAGTSGQGNAGGNGSNGESNGSGGGGGAGAAGASASAYNGGNGGIGATSALINAIGSATGYGELSSGNYYFAGGGGGGTQRSYNQGVGGLGGGGTGGSPNNGVIPTNGTANTGGGAGGGGGGGSVGIRNGGSGIVVVRYAK